MSKRPFIVEPLRGRSGVHRLRSRTVRAAAFVELRNLLTVTPWNTVSITDVAAILAKYHLLPADAEAELRSILTRAAQHAVSHHQLNEVDEAGLKRLQEAFEFSDEKVRTIFLDAARELYRHTLVDALADGQITPEERARLDRIAIDLGLSHSESKQLYEEEALRAIQLVFDHVVADQKVSPDEEQRLSDMSSALGVTLSHDEHTAQILERYRLFGRIDAGVLPDVPVPIQLQRGETCHFSAADVTQKELRTVTKRTRAAGPAASVQVMKGVRFRIGSISSQRIAQDVLTTIDQGPLYVTSKRVLIIGAHKKTSMPLSKLLHFTVFSDGMQIQKDAGKDIFVTGEADWEVAGACLDAAARAGR
jgi:tellurite resistance protein